MSVLLYRLGHAIARRRGVVVAAWLMVLVAVVGSSMALGDRYDDTFTVPGTPSQQGQDLLLDRFDQSGTSAQIIVTASRGSITDGANATAVQQISSAVDAVPHVTMSNPLDATDPVVSSDGRSTLGQALFARAVPSDRTLEQVQAAARTAASSPVSALVGGDAYKSTADPSKVPELLGLMVSFLILCVTFRSLVTAGMPILTALVGVGVTLSAVVVVSSVVTVSSTSPTLAEMLGLAVGIDYALFLLSRYRRQLRDDVTPAEAMARALATAGSAVVFAGTTVVIALLGLTVARIPVLTVMGLAAAAAVVVAVLVALTLLPAIALLLGERLRPRTRSGRSSRVRRLPARRRTARRRRRRGDQHAAADVATESGVPTRWVRLVTRVPLLTVALVVGGLLLAATPALDLELALPDSSTAPESSPQRQTYDAITEAFGEGYNAPLTLTGGVITSDDPVGTVDDWAKGVAKVTGVVDVTQATPNAGGDTALVQVIPRAGQTAGSTSALVSRLRDRSPGWEDEYGVTDILVTGPTAINIDVSERLAGALLPFAAIVIGLSLLLLMVVFRSVAVPVKATFGYLLSVGAALGAVVVVFQWGWLDALLPGIAEGPIVSFLPIFVMGVLFGLAMDYEMFLVSAMREEFVRDGDPRAAVLHGFRASAPVVTAAALIMTSVFVAFVPGGSSTIKPIAMGLAVGVFVDAFVVRMTFVPAVLALLGRSAWWLPGWLERRVPAVDVEGAAMHRRVALQRWQAEHGVAVVRAEALVVSPGGAPLEVSAFAGRVTRVPARGDLRAWGLVLVGRRRPVQGDLAVTDLLLPEQASAVQRRAVLVQVGRPLEPGEVGQPVDALVERRARLSRVTRRGRRAFVKAATAAQGRLEARLTAALAAPRDPGSSGVEPPYGPRRTADQRRVDRIAALDCALAVVGGARLVVLCSTDASDADRGLAVTALAAALVAECLDGDDAAVEAPGADGRGAVSVLVLEAVDPTAGAGEGRTRPAVSTVSSGPAVPAGRGGRS